METIVVTGFSPFSGLEHNPSSAVLDYLPERLGAFTVQKAILSVDTDRIGEELESLYRLDPRIVLHTGLALERPLLTVERRAVNRREFDGADNGGNLVRGQPVVEGGPPELSVRLPVPGIIDAIQGEEIPADGSDWAGEFLCNQALYYSLYHLPRQTLVGFIHLPADEELASRVPWPPLQLVRQARALQITLEIAVRATLGQQMG